MALTIEEIDAYNTQGFVLVKDVLSHSDTKPVIDELEAFIDGNWNRVGVWNDLERNQRQQDFLIRTIQRAIGKGARSVIVQDDLIRAGAEAVVLDARLSIAELLKLGRAFSDFNPSDLSRTLLPVVDSVIGTSEVLELGEGASSSFAVFRGEALSPNDISIRIIDSRGENYNGADTFIFGVSDGALSDTACLLYTSDAADE